MIKEKKIKFNQTEKELQWQSKGLRIKLFQVQGIDIRLVKGDDYSSSYSPYSDPAHKLFTSLLRYFKEADKVPNLDLITSITGIPARRRNNCNGLERAESLIRFYLEEQLPFFQDGKIRVTSINCGYIGTTLSHNFFGYVNGKDFQIGVSAEKGLEMV